MSDYLPPGVIYEILIRLPAESLLKFTSVCKSWNSIIKNPEFIAAHLHHGAASATASGNRLLLFRTCTSESVGYKDRCETYTLRSAADPSRQLCKLEFPFQSLCGSQLFLILGSIHGLVCLADLLFACGNTCIIWNPCIQRFVTLPMPNLRFKNCGPFDISVAFGFDAKTNDYKVVRMLTLTGDPDTPSPVPMLEVYSLAAHKWRTVTCVPPKCKCPLGARGATAGVFVNGALHWVVVRDEYSGPKFILSFNLEDETFGEINFPEKLVNEDYSFHVSVYQGSLALFTTGFYRSELFSLWVMEEYGAEESWTRRMVQPKISHKSVNGVKALDDGKYLWEINEKLVSYSLDSGNCDIKMLGFGGSYVFCDYYVQSLVLLNQPDSESATPNLG